MTTFDLDAKRIGKFYNERVLTKDLTWKTFFFLTKLEKNKF